MGAVLPLNLNTVLYHFSRRNWSNREEFPVGLLRSRLETERTDPQHPLVLHDLIAEGERAARLHTHALDLKSFIFKDVFPLRASDINFLSLHDKHTCSVKLFFLNKFNSI